MQWYYSKNSTQLGPISDTELREKLASGEVMRTDLVWREGMPDWVAVVHVAELSMVLPNPPQIAAQDQTGTLAMNAPYTPPTASGGGIPVGVPTSGLAIASLICGILGLVTCVFVPGIAGVICGHMALNRMADTSSPVGGRGMAIAGLITGYLSVLMLVAFALLMVFGFMARGFH